MARLISASKLEEKINKATAKIEKKHLQNIANLQVRFEAQKAEIAHKVKTQTFAAFLNTAIAEKGFDRDRLYSDFLLTVVTLGTWLTDPNHVPVYKEWVHPSLKLAGVNYYGKPREGLVDYSPEDHNYLQNRASFAIMMSVTPSDGLSELGCAKAVANALVPVLEENGIKYHITARHTLLIEM